MKKLKSPIKSKPLRNPGQSLQKKIMDLVLDNHILYLMITLILAILAGQEWYIYFYNPKPSPWFYTVLTIISFLILIYKIYVTDKKIKKYKQGLDGERAVGQFLDGLRKFGFEVFHDIVFDGFNIDHVVISKNGIFCIETKTYSKPIKGEARIDYDGNSVLVNGFKASAPIIQAKAAAKSLQELLEQTTGKKFNVKPVLLFPGWFIKPNCKDAHKEVWALNPKGFQTFVENKSENISREDIHLITYNLSRYVRTI